MAPVKALRLGTVQHRSMIYLRTVEYGVRVRLQVLLRRMAEPR